MRPRAVLLDIDGVLTGGGRALPGAGEALRLLIDRAFPFRLLTNASRTSRASIAESLGRAGMPVGPERIRTALFAAGEILRERSWRATYLIAPDARADLPPEAPPETADAVLVGDCGMHFTFESLNRVLPALLGGKPLLAVHKNPYWIQDGAPTLDGGAFVAALEFAAGIEAEIVGKPSPSFFLAAAAGVVAESEDPRSIVMVGDRWDTDIEGAHAAGFSGVLVRTGLFRPGDERRGAPDGVLASVSDLPAWLEQRGAFGA